MRKYWGLVHQVDLSVGKILKKLQSLGLDKNTIVVQTEDQSNQGVVVSTILTNAKGKKLKIKMGAFTMLDAETVSGVDANGNPVDLNQVVYTAKNGKSIQIFNYSDDWSTYQSKSKIKAKTCLLYTSPSPRD